VKKLRNLQCRGCARRQNPEIANLDQYFWFGDAQTSQKTWCVLK
jgi:hypothetical protein